VTPEDLLARLRTRFGDVVLSRGEVSASVSPRELVDSLEWLRDESDLRFDFLSDLTCSDWPGLEPRYWVAYHLLSVDHGHRLRVKTGLPDEDEPHAPSVTRMFPTADWFEREVYDFFGVVFDGHPDLRRIEMPEEWTGHPLRKTEPLAGVRTRFVGASVPPPDQRGA